MVKAPLNSVKLPYVEARYRAASTTWSKPKLISDSARLSHSPAIPTTSEKQCLVELHAFRDQYGRMRVFRPLAYAKQIADLATQRSMPEIPSELFENAVRQAVAYNGRNLPGGNDRVLSVRSFLTEAPTSEKDYTLVVLVASPSVDDDNGALEVSIDNFDALNSLISAARPEADQFDKSTMMGIQRNENSTTLIVHNDETLNRVAIDSCVQIARHLGWNVEERLINPGELVKFDELISVNNDMSPDAFRKIFRRSNSDDFVYLGDSSLGNAGTQLQSLITDIQVGKQADAFGWMVEAQQPSSQSPYLEEAMMWQGIIPSQATSRPEMVETNEHMTVNKATEVRDFSSPSAFLEEASMWQNIEPETEATISSSEFLEEAMMWQDTSAAPVSSTVSRTQDMRGSIVSSMKAEPGQTDASSPFLEEATLWQAQTLSDHATEPKNASNPSEFCEEAMLWQATPEIQKTTVEPVIQTKKENVRYSSKGASHNASLSSFSLEALMWQPKDRTVQVTEVEITDSLTEDMVATQLWQGCGAKQAPTSISIVHQAKKSSSINWVISPSSFHAEAKLWQGIY